MARHHLAIGGLIIALGALLVWWFRPPQQVELYRKLGEAWRTRPTEIDESKLDLFSLKFNDKDWKVDPIVLRTGDSCHFTGELDERIVGEIPTEPNVHMMAAFLIVPRLIEQGDKGFEYMDVRVDILLGLPPRRPKRFVLDEKVPKIRLAPGEYRVRLYLQTFVMGPDRRDPDQYTLIHETKMTVEPGDSQEQGLVPLESPKDLIPLILKHSK